jgi:hypothetical protein
MTRRSSKLAVTVAASAAALTFALAGCSDDGASTREGGSGSGSGSGASTSSK